MLLGREEEGSAVLAFSLFSGILDSYTRMLRFNLCVFAMHQLLQLVTRT